MNGPNRKMRAGAFLLALTFLSLSLADPSRAQTLEDLRLRAQGPVDRVVACDNPERGVILTENVIAETTAMVSEEGFVVGNASFTPNGEILLVDDGLKEVWLADRDLNRIRRIGRAGTGPGEYMQPADAVQGEDGRIFVLDRTRGMSRLLIYDPEGNPVGGADLPLAGTRLAVGNSSVFVSGPVLSLLAAVQRGFPFLAEYDLDSGESRILLTADQTWMGKPPLFNILLSKTIPRVGKDGNLYLGWPQGHEVWKINGPDDYSVVLKGCIPEKARDYYREDGGSGSRSFQFIGDFVVLDDGRVMIRTGIPDEEKRRLWESYSSEGALLRTWAIDRPEVHHLGIAINPAQPNEHLTWLRTQGVTRLLVLRSGNAPQER